jgi:hypothetical protein
MRAREEEKAIRQPLSILVSLNLTHLIFFFTSDLLMLAWQRTMWASMKIAKVVLGFRCRNSAGTMLECVDLELNLVL